MVDARSSLAFDEAWIIFEKATTSEYIVVKVEALIQAPATVEYVRTYDRRRIVAICLERLCNRPDLRSQWLPCKVLHAIAKGIGPGQEAGVASKRKRDLRVRSLEQHSITRQGVDRGCFGSFGSVGAHVIGSQGINRDQQDIDACG